MVSTTASPTNSADGMTGILIMVQAPMGARAMGPRAAPALPRGRLSVPTPTVPRVRRRMPLQAPGGGAPRRSNRVRARLHMVRDRIPRAAREAPDPLRVHMEPTGRMEVPHHPVPRLPVRVPCIPGTPLQRHLNHRECPFRRLPPTMILISRISMWETGSPMTVSDWARWFRRRTRARTR